MALLSASHKHPRASVNAHHEPGEVASALHPEGADEEVEDRGEENHDGCYIVQVIQTLLLGAVVQIPTAWGSHTSPNTNRQTHQLGKKAHLVMHIAQVLPSFSSKHTESLNLFIFS